MHVERKLLHLGTAKADWRTKGVCELTDWSILSNDLKVCYVIYDCQKNRKKIWFSKLVEVLANDVSRATISKSLDKLFDLGMIDGNWEKVDGKWTRVFKIAGEAEDLVKAIYENTKRPTN